MSMVLGGNSTELTFSEHTRYWQQVLAANKEVNGTLITAEESLDVSTERHSVSE